MPLPSASPPLLRAAERVPEEKKMTINIEGEIQIFAEAAYGYEFAIAGERLKVGPYPPACKYGL